MTGSDSDSEDTTRSDTVFEQAGKSAQKSESWKGLGDSENDGDGSGKQDDRNSDNRDSRQQQSSTSQSQSSSSSQGHDELPHRVKFDSPKDDRDTKTLYVGDDDKERIHDLEALANSIFDQKVYITDVYLAALRSDFYDDDSFIEEMRNIGYGYFD